MKSPGLSHPEVIASRSAHGSNALTEIPSKSLWKIVLDGFSNPMIAILLVALCIQVVLWLLGKILWYEPLGIFVAILIANGVSALFEHRQAGKALALRREASSREQTKVKRDGVLQPIPVAEVVVGDLVFLQAGDKIPADGVVLEGELKVDQAVLNGESEEAAKHAGPPDTPLDTRDLCHPYSIFRGCVVCAGEAWLQVRVVGDRTLFGQAALGAQESVRETPLQVKLGRLARQIAHFGYWGGGAMVAAVVCASLLRGEAPADFASWLQLLVEASTVAVTIIVCAVPEGLPMLSSLLQAQQSLKMVRDNVLVRKIHGLETAGSLSILFCDKTGTITEGRLAVAEVRTGSGNTYQRLAQLPAALQEALRIGIGCNNAAIAGPDGVFGGNTTDRALMQYLQDAGQASGLENYRILAKRPFDPVQKSSGILLQRNNLKEAFCKGAPEPLLARCTAFLDDEGMLRNWSDHAKRQMNDYLDAQAKRSMRLLAVAKSIGEEEQGPLALIALVCIRDAVRQTAKAAIEDIQHAGIQVVMVTGDRLETAVAIGRDAGLLESPDDWVLASAELSQLSDDEIKAKLPRLRVVARALPLDKSRLVRLAQECNLVVGMTGDGVNDAPALRKADVGFAMGSGTAVAQEAGDITILDDNLASIKTAILYGRTMFKCIRKFLAFQLSVNFAAVFTCAIAPVFGENFVLTVIQLLLINLAMDTLAALAYGSEPPRQEYLLEKPVPRDEGIVTPAMLSQVLVSATYLTALCLFILFIPAAQKFIAIIGESAAERTRYLHSALFATFMMTIAFNAFNARTSHLNPLEGIAKNWTFVAVMSALFLMQFLFVTFGGETLAVTPLSLQTWLCCLAFSFFVIPVDLLRKMLAGITK